ncbi:hypothetical protein MASR2M12_11130 [Bacteroidales bacterium]
MDGLKYVVPMSCHTKKVVVKGVAILFGTEEDRVEEKPCQGCMNKTATGHTGNYVKIMDWREGKVIEFVSMVESTFIR